MSIVEEALQRLFRDSIGGDHSSGETIGRTFVVVLQILWGESNFQSDFFSFVCQTRIPRVLLFLYPFPKTGFLFFRCKNPPCPRCWNSPVHLFLPFCHTDFAPQCSLLRLKSRCEACSATISRWLGMFRMVGISAAGGDETSQGTKSVTMSSSSAQKISCEIVPWIGSQVFVVCCTQPRQASSGVCKPSLRKRY